MKEKVAKKITICQLCLNLGTSGADILHGSLLRDLLGFDRVT